MRRSTVVMLILLALLAGLYWYMQQPENVIERAIQPTATATAIDLGYIVAPEKGPVRRVIIERNDGKTINLDKNTGAWLLLTSVGAIPADQTAAEAAAGQATNLRILAKLEPAPKAAAIGLDKPAYQFSLILNNGETLKFSVGAKTVTQTGYYVQTADGKVYVVGAYGINTLSELVDSPPFLHTPTPTLLPVTETPVPTATSAPSPTPELAPSPTATP